MSKKILMNNYSVFNFNNENCFIIEEDFEDDVFNLDIVGDWSRYATNEMESGGNYVYKSKPINNSEESSFSFVIEQKSFDKCVLYFSYDVSSEPNADVLKVFVNNAERCKIYGSGYYFIEIECSIVNQIKFSYIKDGSYSAGRDNAYIGKLEIMYYNSSAIFNTNKVIENFIQNDILITNDKWIIDDSCITSEQITDSQLTTTRMLLTDDIKYHVIKITYDISSEIGYDEFLLKMYNSDNIHNFINTTVHSNSGIKQNQSILIPISNIYELSFEYKKDGGGKQGEDCVKITKIEFGYFS